jgi:vacuolar iron transporter family protein
MLKNPSKFNRKEYKELIEHALNRKEKYLSENVRYRRFEKMMHSHTTGKYIGDFIYGANDGIITTFAVVAAAAGASLSPVIIIILGFANLFADGISMGASNYLGERSEEDYAKAQREKEEWEVDNLRELEVDEIRDIFEKKGFKGKDLERAVEIIISDRKVWVDTMMRDELNILEHDDDSPVRHGFATFVAFVVAGFFPLVPYIIPSFGSPFLLSIVVAMLTLFVVGASRSYVTAVSWIRGGFEMFAVGSFAAASAYFIGGFIESLVR